MENKIEITNKAIDSASIRVLHKWRQHSKSCKEGIVTFIKRVSNDAINDSGEVKIVNPFKSCDDEAICFIVSRLGMDITIRKDSDLYTILNLSVTRSL